MNVRQCHSCTAQKSKKSLLAPLMLVLAFCSGQSAAAQNSGSSTAALAPPSQCKVHVVVNDIVVPDRERREVAYHVLPAGIIPQPGQWPYFAWPDTPLGVVRTRDESGYLFFGSDGGCHKDCNGKAPRSGSITVSTGTLDQPLGVPLGDPNPPVHEFLLPTSVNLPDYIDYVGGGPVYRVPEGEIGAGNLLLVYHAERPANPFWSWLGLAKSTDEGLTWQDLGLIVGMPYNPNGALDIGNGTLVVTVDPVTSKKYFYTYFGTVTTYLSVARASYEELLYIAFMANSDSPSTIASKLFHKYYKGKWDQSGLFGQASELFPGVTGLTDGNPEVYWSDYRHRFIAIEGNGVDIAYGESVDGLYWPPMQAIFAASGTAGATYAIATGLGEDPNILGDTFYSYFTATPLGVSWQPATLDRLTVTTAADLKSIAPSSATAGGSGFTLTANGDHFVPASTVMWNGSARTTTYVSANQVTAQILASDIANAGEANVEVSNPAPCGGDSSARPFTISSRQ